ncbi:MAG TPA: S-layer homology domain-containing protein, partial [Ruminiclostridium sp.]|nr:S-layer homology domain-containing protein [Ruminiclostridium sp.]
AEIISNGVYDADTGKVTFMTDNIAQYVVGYNKVTFNDVKENAWYGDAVTFLAARDITTGKGDNNFGPNDKLTRGQFLVMLMNAYGQKPDENSKDNFADAGNAYYTGYLAVAKRLGISEGIGENKFAPNKEITRQEMITLLYKALKLMDEQPTGNNGKALTDFSDNGAIAPWAKDAMSAFVEAGIVVGSDNKLTPSATTNRAQLAQVLFNLLSR